MRPEPAVEAEPFQVQLCAFVVGAEEYAIDIHRVLEILQPPAATQVPGASQVDGVVNLRGEIVPMVDLRRALGVKGPPDLLRQKLLVCLLGRRKIGFRVDRVTQVVRASLDELKPVPSLGEGGVPLSPYVIGVCSRGSRLLLLLDLRAVLSPEARPPGRSAASPWGGGLSPEARPPGRSAASPSGEESGA